jgi:hypothetical protein
VPCARVALYGKGAQLSGSLANAFPALNRNRRFLVRAGAVPTSFALCGGDPLRAQLAEPRCLRPAARASLLPPQTLRGCALRPHKRLHRLRLLPSLAQPACRHGQLQEHQTRALQCARLSRV